MKKGFVMNHSHSAKCSVTKRKLFLEEEDRFWDDMKLKILSQPEQDLAKNTGTVCFSKEPCYFL